MMGVDLFVLIALCYGRTYRHDISNKIAELSGGLIPSDNWRMYHKNGPLARLVRNGYVEHTKTAAAGRVSGDYYVITKEGIEALAVSTAIYTKYSEEGNNALKHAAATAPRT